jgi:hypothetical protein
MDPFEWAAVGFIVIWVAFAYDEAKKARRNGEFIIKEIKNIKERIIVIEGILSGGTDIAMHQDNPPISNND